MTIICYKFTLNFSEFNIRKLVSLLKKPVLCNSEKLMTRR